MLEQTKRIAFSIFSVLSKVEPEPDLNASSDQKLPAPAPQHCTAMLVTAPHMSVHGDNTTPISNFGDAELGPMVQLQVWVPAGVDLRSTDLVQWGSIDVYEVSILTLIQ